MKTIMSIFIAVFFSVMLFSMPKALASGAVQVRDVLGTSPIWKFGYKELISSTVKGVKGVQINNTGPQAVKLAFGASGSEVDQILINGNQDTGFLPLSGGYASRVSVVALDGTSDTGEFDLNVFYN